MIFSHRQEWCAVPSHAPLSESELDHVLVRHCSLFARLLGDHWMADRAVLVSDWDAVGALNGERARKCC